MKNKKLYYGLGALGALLVVTLAAFALNGAGSNISGNLGNVAVKLQPQKNIPGLAPVADQRAAAPSPTPSKPQAPVSSNPGLTFNTDTILPTVTIASPIIGAKIPGQMFTITAFASDNVKVSKVEFQIDGVKVKTLNEPNVANSNHYKYDFNTSNLPKNKLILISVLAYDTAGHFTTASASITANYTNDKTLPTVTINSPSDGQTIHGGSFTIIAHAYDNTKVTKVEFRINGSLVNKPKANADADGDIYAYVYADGEKADPNDNVYKFTLNTGTLPYNKLTPLDVWAYDEAGNIGKKTISIISDNQAAGLTITSPKVGDIITPPLMSGKTDYTSRDLVLKVSGFTTEETKIYYSIDGGEEIARTENSLSYDFEYVVSPVTWTVTKYNDLWNGQYTKVVLKWGVEPGALKAGDHTFTVIAKDKSFNISKKTITFNLLYGSNPETAPKITIKSIK